MTIMVLLSTRSWTEVVVPDNWTRMTYKETQDWLHNRYQEDGWQRWLTVPEYWKEIKGEA